MRYEGLIRMLSDLGIEITGAFTSVREKLTCIAVKFNGEDEAVFLDDRGVVLASWL